MRQRTCFGCGYTAIPDRHSAYGVNVSPPLQWSGHPATTRTFARPKVPTNQPQPVFWRPKF